MNIASSALRAAVLALAVSLVISCTTIPPLGVDRVRRVEFTVLTAERSQNGLSGSGLSGAEISAGELSDNAPLDGYRIAFVSDVHLGNNFSIERFRRLIDSINAERPDCILIGGDDTLGWAEIPDFAREASRLAAPDGVYATLGNHDFYNGRAESIETLREAGIVVLQDTLVQTPGGPIIAGINDFRDVYPAMNRFRDILAPEPFTVLVSHNPDFVEKIPTEDLRLFDLVLCGHTHGGQITLFGYAPVIPSEYGQKYRTGTVWKDGVPVVISNGAGFSGMFLRFRLFAPSDFLLITLKGTR